MLVLAPHTDDGELGCGGTIAKSIEAGTELMYVAFSSADRSLAKKYPKGTLRTELLKATSVLGIPRKNVICLDFDVRSFHARRQEILEEMVRLNKDFRPDVVLSPSLNDLHQDHKIVAEEGRRMFKRNTILGYEMPWNNISFDTFCFSVLNKSHIDKKIDALMCYESQRHREYVNREFILSLARTRGVQINVPFAEAFEVVRWIMR